MLFVLPMVEGMSWLPLRGFRHGLSRTHATGAQPWDVGIGVSTFRLIQIGIQPPGGHFCRPGVACLCLSLAYAHCPSLLLSFFLSFCLSLFLSFFLSFFRSFFLCLFLSFLSSFFPCFPLSLSLALSLFRGLDPTWNIITTAPRFAGAGLLPSRLQHVAPEPRACWHLGLGPGPRPHLLAASFEELRKARC